jgi:hypothetical protein
MSLLVIMARPLRFSFKSLSRSRRRSESSAGVSYLLELLEIDELADDPPSRWFGTQCAASELGLEVGGRVGIGDLVAASELLGPVVELLFIAPVSVSTIWALDPDESDAISRAHQDAVDLALAQLGFAIGAVPVAAQFVHQFARLPPPPGTPPPQLHTHALVIAVDMDEEPEESFVVGPPSSLPPSRARLGFVPDGLDKVASLAEDAYRARLSVHLGQRGYPVDAHGEVSGVPDGLMLEFAPVPCGMGSLGHAVYLPGLSPNS